MPSIKDFRSRLAALVKEQGGEEFVALALDEFSFDYVEDVPPELRAWVLSRAKALWEEDQ